MTRVQNWIWIDGTSSKVVSLERWGHHATRWWNVIITRPIFINISTTDSILHSPHGRAMCAYGVSIVNTWWRHQMETFSALLALCAGNSPVPVNSPHKGQWRGALMFSLICAWINGWVNNREAGDLGRHRGHYDVNVMGTSNNTSKSGGRKWKYGILDGMLMSNTICKLLIDYKILISVLFLCSGQVLYLNPVLEYDFPLSITRTTGIVDGSYIIHRIAVFNFVLCWTYDVVRLMLLCSLCYTRR